MNGLKTLWVSETCAWALTGVDGAILDARVPDCTLDRRPGGSLNVPPATKTSPKEQLAKIAKEFDAITTAAN